MLNKALQQPDGKISEQILYTEEEVEILCYEAFIAGAKYIINRKTISYEPISKYPIADWWSKHRKH